MLLSMVGRFKNVPMPQRNSLLSLVGEVIDTHEESKMFAILLHDITYLSSKIRGKAATTTGISNAPAGSLGDLPNNEYGGL